MVLHHAPIRNGCENSSRPHLSTAASYYSEGCTNITSRINEGFGRFTFSDGHGIKTNYGHGKKVVMSRSSSDIVETVVTSPGNLLLLNVRGSCVRRGEMLKIVRALSNFHVQQLELVNVLG